MNVQHGVQERSLRMPLLVRVFEGLGFYPNPDDPDGGWGPAGPYVHLIQELFRVRAGIALGPHPEPWREVLGPRPEPWREVLGPQPEPWRLVASGAQARVFHGIGAARQAAKSLVNLAYTANALGEEPARAFAVRMSEFIDDWCGTPPRHHIPLPGPGDPWPGGGDEPRPISPMALTMMGVNLFRASKALGDTLLGQQLAEAGERLAQVGLERLGSQG